MVSSRSLETPHRRTPTRESGYFYALSRSIENLGSGVSIGYSGREWANKIPFGGICPPFDDGF
nr:MAG TPA: hypothetical protein [Caudoviricetes sp.]